MRCYIKNKTACRKIVKSWTNGFNEILGIILEEGYVRNIFSDHGNQVCVYYKQGRSEFYNIVEVDKIITALKNNN